MHLKLSFLTVGLPVLLLQVLIFGRPVDAVVGSVFSSLPDDSRAIDANAPEYGLVPDGHHDCSTGLQAAVNAAYNASKPALLARIVFIGPGTYLLKRTVLLPMYLRVIGWGVGTRPLFLLAPNTPTFGNVSAPRALFTFAQYEPPALPPAYVDGGNIVFATALINVDIQIESGNPGAVAVRFRGAQGAALRAMDISLAPDAFAAVMYPGWSMQDVDITGAKFGIIFGQTGAWHSSLRSVRVTAQTNSSIAFLPINVWQEPCEGFSCIGCTIGGGESLYGLLSGHWPLRAHLEGSLFLGSRLADISVGNSTDPELQLSLVNSSGSSVSPLLVEFRDEPESSVPVPTGGAGYALESLVRGYVANVSSSGGAAQPSLQLVVRGLVSSPAMPPPPSPSWQDFPYPPLPTSAWVSARNFGAVGDGVTDDTDALRAALAAQAGTPGGGALYLPSGTYFVTDTLVLPPNVTLFGLHCRDAAIGLGDYSPGYGNPAAPKPVLHVPCGGPADLPPAVFGLALAARRSSPMPNPANGSYPNNGAITLLWEASAGRYSDSFLVRSVATGSPTGPQAEGADDAATGAGGGCNTAHSLWVRDGGACAISDVWSSDSKASEGLLVSNSSGGRVTQLSSEHHAGHEVRLVNGSAHWRLLTVQTEDIPDNTSSCGLGSTPLRCEGACEGVALLQGKFYRSSQAFGGWPQAVLLDPQAAPSPSGTLPIILGAHFYSGSRLNGSNYDAMLRFSAGGGGGSSLSASSIALVAVTAGNASLPPP